MTRQLAQNVNTLRAIALVMATLCILAGSLTMPTQSVQAGFTPAPTSPVPTPIPPTASVDRFRKSRRCSKVFSRFVAIAPLRSCDQPFLFTRLCAG